MPDQLVQLAVHEVRAAVPLSSGQEAGLVVLSEQSPPFRALNIYIGQAEARAIQAGRRAVPPQRPSTWDLFLSALALLDARVSKAVITSVVEGRHYFANLQAVPP